MLFSPSALLRLQAKLSGHRSWLEPLTVVSRFAFSSEGIFLLVPPLVWWMPAHGSFVLLCLALSELWNGILKWGLQRPRPFWSVVGLESIGGFVEKDFSCPSSHSQTVACLITALFWRFDTLRNDSVLSLLLLVLTIWIGFCRCYMGVHFPGDVLLGWAMGAVVVAAVDASQVIPWFEDKLTFSEQAAVGCLASLVATSLLVLVRMLVPDVSPILLDRWTKTAKKNLPLYPSRNQLDIKPRILSTYFFQLGILPGGCVGLAFAERGLRRLQLSFLEETCTLEDLASGAGVRILIGITGLALLFVPAFGTPDVLGRKKRTKGTDAVQLLSFALAGMWLMFGAPYVSDVYFHKHCHIFTCDPEILGDGGSSLQKNFERYVNPSGYNITRPCMVGETINRVNIHPKVMTSVQDIIDAVTESKLAGKYLRVVGAGHSSPVIGLHPLDTNTTYITLQHPNFQGYKKSSDSKHRPLAIAGAGIWIGDNPEFPEATVEKSLVYQLWQDGLALADVGGVMLQTLGGFLNVGSAGGSHQHSLHDQIIGFKWVNGNGELREAWRNHTDPTLFFTLGVNMGLAGVIYEYILRPEKAYCARMTTKGIFSASKSNRFYPLDNATVDDGDLFEYLTTADSARILTPYFPNTKHGSLLWPARSERVLYPSEECPQDILERRGSSAITDYHIPAHKLFSMLSVVYCEGCFNETDNVCRWKTAKRVLNPPSGSRGDIISGQACLKLLSELTAEERERVQFLGPSDDLFQLCLAGVGAEFDGFPDQQVEPFRSVVAPYWQILPYDQRGVWYIYNEVNCEIIFPLRPETNTTQLFLKVKDIFTSHGFPMAPAGIEWYPGKASEFYLHPSYGIKTMRLGLFWWMFSDGNPKTYFSQFWEAFRQEGIEFRFHWGKYLPAAADIDPACPSEFENVIEHVLTSFDKLEEFKRAVVAEDPSGIFRTPYWKKTLQFHYEDD